MRNLLNKKTVPQDVDYTIVALNDGKITVTAPRKEMVMAYVSNEGSITPNFDELEEWQMEYIYEVEKGSTIGDLLKLMMERGHVTEVDEDGTVYSVTGGSLLGYDCGDGITIWYRSDNLIHVTDVLNENTIITWYSPT